MMAHHTASFSGGRRLGKQDLRKAGLKVTGPRLKILEILEESDPSYVLRRHLQTRSNPTRTRSCHGLSVLTQFQAAGLVSRHHFEDGMAVFELNQGTHHDHIVCLDCGRVEEFVDESIEERQEAIAQRLGYELRDHAMTLYGHCRKPGCPSFKGQSFTGKPGFKHS
jgi:Fur family ferric uptake transcriptional regulator